MTDKKELIKEIIRNNPNVSGNQIFNQVKGTELGIRKQTFFEILRETRKLAEPTIQKRERSIPKIFKTPKTKAEVRVKAKERIELRKPKPIPKKERIPFEKTKFGKMSKTIQTVFNISERNANDRLRILLKIPKKDFRKLNKKDFDILTQFGY